MSPLKIVHIQTGLRWLLIFNEDINAWGYLLKIASHSVLSAVQSSEDRNIPCTSLRRWLSTVLSSEDKNISCTKKVAINSALFRR